LLFVGRGDAAKGNNATVSMPGRVSSCRTAFRPGVFHANIL
jgi:hypothetical protein